MHVNHSKTARRLDDKRMHHPQKGHSQVKSQVNSFWFAAAEHLQARDTSMRETETKLQVKLFHSWQAIKDLFLAIARWCVCDYHYRKSEQELNLIRSQ